MGENKVFAGENKTFLVLASRTRASFERTYGIRKLINQNKVSEANV